MKRIGMGLVGPGFVGMHHIDAVRRLGSVDVVAIADGDDTLAREKASAIGAPKAYGSFEALARDPDVDVIHNTTPNFVVPNSALGNPAFGTISGTGNNIPRQMQFAVKYLF